jgi:hypothetical protein
MTKIFERAVQPPATHAFVIGVGGYPYAKPGQGIDPALRNVRQADVQLVAQQPGQSDCSAGQR